MLILPVPYTGLPAGVQYDEDCDVCRHLFSGVSGSFFQPVSSMMRIATHDGPVVSFKHYLFQPVSSMMRIATSCSMLSLLHMMYFQPVSSMMRIATKNFFTIKILSLKLPAGVQYDEDCDLSPHLVYSSNTVLPAGVQYDEDCDFY